MASIFPPSPIVGDYFTSNNTTWQWNGEAWVVLPAEGTTFKNIVTSPSTETVVADSGADTLTIIGGDYITVSASTSNDSVKISAPLIGDIIASISPSSASAAATSLHLYVKNTSGSTIYAGQAVYVTGATGADVSVGLSSNQAESTSSKTLGLAYQNIPNDSFGYIITEGNLIGDGSRPVDTSSATPGDPIWLGSTPGSKIFGLTNKPKAPNHLVYLGVVVRSHAINGVIYVKVQNGFELQELHDVRIVSASAGDIIEWNSASSIWVNSPKQNIINTASATAYTSAINYTNTQINALTTTDIEEGSNLYYTDLRVLGTASSALVHDNHTNITATYNSASNQIVLNTSGGLPAFGFGQPPIEGSEGQVYYQINSASTQILNYYQYINNEWVEIDSSFGNWNYLLDGSWQFVLDEATGGWVALYNNDSFTNSASIDFNYRYIPHLVGEILFLTRESASATYLSLSTASTLYLSKNGGTVNGNLIVDGNFTVAGSVAYLNTEHVHIENNFITLNTGASGAYLNSGIEVYRGASPSVKIIFDENTDTWSFTNDGINYNELGSGGGTVLYQVDQPDVSELEPGALWVDSDQDAVSGLIPATFSRWVKTLSASTSTISGVDDNSETLLYNVDNEQVFINGTLLVRDNDYVGTSGSAIVLTEPASVGDVVEIHSYQQIVLVDTYTTGEVDSLLDNIDALPSQTGNTGKYLTTNGSSASWGVLVIPETSSAAFTRWTKVYAASATLIGGADDNAINLEYDLGLEQLFINGVMIARNEYTATSGSTIVLNDALSVNDVVDIYSYQNTNNISTYSQAQIDAKYNQYTRWKKIYSASATVISGNDDNSLPLSYTSGYEQVYLNGILLTPITDYARTSASVITLPSAVVTNDVIEIIDTQPFNVADVYTTSQANSTFLTQVSASTTYATQAQVAIIDVDNMPDIFLMMG